MAVKVLIMLLIILNENTSQNYLRRLIENQKILRSTMLRSIGLRKFFLDRKSVKCPIFSWVDEIVAKLNITHRKTCVGVF